MSASIDTSAIHWIVDRYHVATPAKEVIADIDKRTTHWPAAARRKARTCARRRHKANLRTYVAVMGSNPIEAMVCFNELYENEVSS